ncbi:outer membrane beta-barrel protein [Phyllobacterium salinisoli]|uniref:outer membrane beta-barrel protein n=1 Tax=Phyllobacterium salinisoli TaxID=1899321 RepID=UPI001FE0717E|nr:outer membrane beta-barrel protein [Phyllobacterium salinisoli]
MLLLAGVAIGAEGFSAQAQDAGLRGSVPENVLATSGTTAQSGQQQRRQLPPPSYEPVSPGALPSVDLSDESDGANIEGGDAMANDGANLNDATLAGQPIQPAGQESSTISDQSAAPRAPRPTDEADADQPVSVDNLRTSTVNSEEQNDTGRAMSENERQPTVDGRPRSPVEQDPFAPVGLRLGSFLLRPSIEQGIRITSNADNSSTGSSATLSETTLRLNARSDWSRHQATLDASGTIAKTISGQDVSEPRLDIESGLRLDLSDQTTLNTGAGYHLRRESANNPFGVVGALKRPIVQTLNGTLGVEREIGLLFGAITGRVERSVYGDAELSSGGEVSQKDRDNTFASVTLRGGYQLSAAIRPFIEIEVGKRAYDEKRDSNGYERGATRLGARAGALIDMGEKLNGEFSIGYLRENIEDERLEDIRGLSLNAAMNWSPERGTDVRLAAQTIVEGGTAPGESGSVLYLANIDVRRLIRANLTLEAGLDLTVRDNHDGSGLDRGLGAEVGATYWFNRFVGINGSLRHEFMKSDVASREYTSNSVYLGVKMQR